jgi:putative membrane-bound dehydrogenase-like protein
MTPTHTFLTITAMCALMFASCGSGKNNKDAKALDSLPEEQRHRAENAIKGLEVADGLEVQLMAAEPIIRNPTNIDVDGRGRIWVTEAFNYRPGQGSTTIPEGDRIMILEDNDGDGVAEVNKVFYQGPEINAPLGICVVDNKVIVSQSPFVWAFYDDNKDDKADRKEIIFQGIRGVQHDHGMHSFTAGPDGKLYFNFGNDAVTLRDKNNKPVLDQYGDSIGSKKYRMGMVFRCDPDGSNVERLAHNFRNNYEVCTDSYGTMWQSDNDDDGNRGVRINYVMDYGNYGFTDEMTGASWSETRTNMEDSIPFRHWHLNDPGVVPNLLQTGSGSPAGILLYEGDLLPEKFRNQMIHCEPGHNVVRAYPVKKDGAGYSATIENILEGEHDQWFRPADVCVAPDGSLIVADWYDPVVGGHDAKDKESGRIYRIAPKGVAYKIPKFNYSTVEGAIGALQNPNLFVRRQAWTALQNFGSKAVPALEQMWQSSGNDRMKARAFWVLVKMQGGEKYIGEAIKHSNPDIRIAGLRAARQLNSNVIGVISQLINDKELQVRRECALALHFNKSPEAPKLWAELAAQHDGKDRWYLEALGIGAANQWDSFFAAYLLKVPDPLQSAAGRDIVWRARTDKSLPLLAKLAGDESADLKSRLRYFRAFDFNPSPAKTSTLLGIIRNNKSNNIDLNAVVLAGLDPKIIKSSPEAKNALGHVLQSVYGTQTYIDLVKKYELKSETPRLIQLALDKPENDVATEAIKLIYNFKNESAIKAILNGNDEQKTVRLLTAFSKVGFEQTNNIYQHVLLGKNFPDTIRRAAAYMMGRTWMGEDFVMSLVKANRVPEQYMPNILAGLEFGPRRSMLLKIQDIINESKGGNKNRAPFNPDSVLALKGNAAHGGEVFKRNCAICHQVKGEGTDFGPKLTEIGSKLPKDGLLEAIVNPSAGVSFGYETTELQMKDGNTLTGLVSSKTEDEISLKMPGGSINKVSRSDIKLMKQSTESMMPALHETMTKQDLADLLDYLSTLQKK